LIRDLTEWKRAERRVEASLRSLEGTNRQLSQFASAIAHDLKSPLRIIRSYADFLEQDVGASLPEKQRSYLEGIGAAVRLAEEQLSGLMRLARIRESELVCRKTRLGPLVRKLVHTAASSDQARIELGDGWPTIITEPLLLRQVMGNLLENALKYNPSEKRAVDLGWVRLPERHIELFVRDNGPGIPAEHHEKIFQPFRRLHAQSTIEGSGLGLSIARTAAERLGGSIRLRSKVGKGSTFYVRLPEEGPQPDGSAEC